VVDGELRGRHVAHDLGENPRADMRALHGAGLLRVADELQAGQSRAHHDARAPALRVEAALGERLLRGGKGVLHEQIQIEAEPGWQHVPRVEILHLGRAHDGQLLCVQPRNGTDAALAGHKSLPVVRNADAHGGHGAHAGDDQFFPHVTAPPF